MYERFYTFGQFLRHIRNDSGLTLRSLGEKLSFSASYLSDVENSRRYPPDIETLYKIALVCNLSDEDKDLLFDLAGNQRNEVPADIKQYIMGIPIIKTFLREAMRSDFSNEDWEILIDTIRQEG